MFQNLKRPWSHFFLHVELKLLGLEGFDTDQEGCLLGSDEQPAVFGHDVQEHAVSLELRKDGQVTSSWQHLVYLFQVLLQVFDFVWDLQHFLGKRSQFQNKRWGAQKRDWVEVAGA